MPVSTGSLLSTALPCIALRTRPDLRSQASPTTRQAICGPQRPLRISWLNFLEQTPRISEADISTGVDCLRVRECRNLQGFLEKGRIDHAATRPAARRRKLLKRRGPSYAEGRCILTYRRLTGSDLMLAYRD